MRRVIFFVAILTCTSFGQELWKYPPTVLDAQKQARWVEARRQFDLQNFEESRDLCLQLANENPGTAFGAGALMGARYAQQMNGDRIGAEATRLRIISEYPGSRFEVAARRSVADENPSVGAYSDLLASLGAPRLEAIMANENLQASTRQLLALHPEVRYGLASTYLIGISYASNPRQAVNVARFAHQAFGTTPTEDIDFLYELQASLGTLNGKDIPMIPAPSRPTVTVITPAPGSTVGTQPIISFRTTSGDYTKEQVSLQSLVFKVDGVPRQLEALIDSQVDETLSPGVDFEVLTASITPTLAPGPHTVEVSVKTGRYPSSSDNTTSKTWSFTVSNSPPPPPPPTSQTLQASKDALVYEKNPHSNEGANPKLTLEKITGKASRNLLGFNLSGINAATVSKATLILTIEPSDQATGWGNGDTVNVKPVTVAWQEGNGKSYGLSSSQQTAGSGAGTTWFSPTDDNISNNSSNSVTQWSGGATYATAGAAPPLTVQNHQTGELRFNVTADVRAGAVQGWLLRKDAENKGSKVTFYSKEGAAAAGNPALAPRLILEFGSTTTQAPAKSWLAIVLNLMEQGYLQLQAYRTPPALSWLGLTIN